MSKVWASLFRPSPDGGKPLKFSGYFSTFVELYGVVASESVSLTLLT